MRTKTVIQRIGEHLGPVDWSYDFWSHDWDHGGCVNPACVDAAIRALIRLTREPDAEWRYVEYGLFEPIVTVGMYDGWPYWRPVPSIATRTPYGIEWHSFCSIRILKVAPAPEPE